MVAVKWSDICNYSLLISELHGIPEYNISVVANSEEQAKTSPDEVHKCVKKMRFYRERLKPH